MLPGKKRFSSLLLLLCATLATGQSRYELIPAWDYPALGVGISAAGLAYLRERDIARNAIDPSAYSRKDIPIFDRWAIGPYSQPLSIASDVLIGMEGLAPALMTGCEFGRGEESFAEAWRDAVIYGEVVAYASAFSLYSKTFLVHPRPLVFTDNAPQSERTSGDSRSGFFSEHTTGAFAAAVFTGYTFALKHPESPWIPWVWGGSLGTATTIGALRVASGKHFPSDVLAGAAVGALVGYAIPRMHARSRTDSPGRQLKRGPDGFLSRMELAIEPRSDGETPMLLVRIHG